MVPGVPAPVSDVLVPDPVQIKTKFPKFHGFDNFVDSFCQVSWRLEGHLNITKNMCWSDLLSLRRSLVKQIPRKELDWVGG